MRWNPSFPSFVVKWTLLGGWVGILSGLASALFLWLLDRATHIHSQNSFLLFGLPLAGVPIAMIYRSKIGKDVSGGTNLLLDTIHGEGDQIPVRMAPLILITTVATHLFGGSAGREGTAVQMGGSLANLAVGPLHLSKADQSVLIMTGIAAGFGSVFGTPVAGAIFGLEVLSIGRQRYNALVPCLVASIVGDQVCRGVGISHHDYHMTDAVNLVSPAVFYVLLAAVLFAGASILFTELCHRIQGLAKDKVWKPIAGGVAIVILTYMVGNRDYNGLSLPLLERAFTPETIALYAFAVKILFTSITLGTGFKGGEVTPLFVIGATLGHSFATLTGQNPVVFAALGFAAVFAAAANTPIACTLMGIELFGGQLATPMAIVCVLSYVLSGHRGIYASQRITHSKDHQSTFAEGSTIANPVNSAPT